MYGDSNGNDGGDNDGNSCVCHDDYTDANDGYDIFLIYF